MQLQGETKSHAITADSGNVNTRHFCPNCGSRIFSANSARAGVRGVAVGCADTHDWFEPGAVVYCKDRATWDVTSTDIPNFDSMPPAS